MAIVSTYPVSLVYNYGPNVGTNNSAYTTTDGFFYNLSPMLSAVKDATFNQSTLSVLTNNILLSNSLSGVKFLDNSAYVTQTTISVGYLGTGGPINYLTTTTALSAPVRVTSDITKATVFTLQFNNDYTVSIFYNGNYLTQDGTNVLKFEAYNSNAFPTNQSFYYNIHNNNISLFTVVDHKVLSVNYDSYSIYTLLTTTYSGFTSNNILSLDRFVSTFYKKLGETSNVQYVPTTNSIDIQKATTNLAHNYLVTTPYGNVDTNTNSLYYNVTPLKNYYSPEHLQTPTLSAQSRTYNKLYTGLNAENGNDKIYLSYLGTELTKFFAKDKNTYFHYPDGAPVVALSSSTLALAGATPGASPWRSDRIFVKKADYGTYTPWGSYPGVQNGTFFCSWLSAGAPGVTPTWMDRYFDPTRTNLTTVLSSTGAGPSNNNLPNLIWDVPSTQILTPECLYVYHKIGDVDNGMVVDGLSGSLTHHITEWTDPIIDGTYGTTIGNVYNLSATSVTTFTGTRYPALNTSISYATLDISSSDFYVPGFTIAFNAYNTDWTHIKGDQIIGNYYGGGIGLFKNNPLLTPFITIVGDYINTTNTGFVSLYNTVLAPVSNNNIVLKSNYNESYFIVDSYNNLYEYDQDGVKVAQTALSGISGSIYDARLIYENGIREVFVASTVSSTINWYKYNTTGKLLSSGSGTGVSYGLDLNNIVYYTNDKGNCVVDNNNIVFALSGDKLVKGINTSNPQFILSAYKAEYIACDHLNNIWLLYNDRSLSKIDNYGRIIWDVNLTSGQFFTDNTGAFRNPNRILNFTAELDPVTNALNYYGIVLDGKSQNVFKVDPVKGLVYLKYTATGIDYNSLSATTLNCRPAGDTTGFDYQRKYIYDSNSSGSLLKLKALVENVSTLNQSGYSYELDYDASTLTPGWHHFAITIDTYNNLNMYVDGALSVSTLVGNLSAGIYRIYNQRNNPQIVIGTSSFKTQTLALFTKQPTDPYAFNGYISDVRLYDQALQKADIEALQKNFNLNSFLDLYWSSPAGSRYYIEQVDRFFPHRLPGAKSQLFNIKIKNSNITDPNVRKIIEQNILSSLSKTTPVHTQVNQIIWQ